MPFFILQEPYSKLLTILARGDGKLYSSLHKAKIGDSFGQEMILELIENKIIYMVNSREKPIKEFEKQLIKKEYKDYKIEPKLFFYKPFFRFWFSIIHPSIDKYGYINKEKVLYFFNRYNKRLKSLIFEQLSIELLKEHFKDDKIVEVASFWDRFSEFDIYAKTANNKKIIGECKYTNRQLTKAQIVKLEKKISQSNLEYDFLALFSKSGFSNEINRLNRKNLLLFKLEDFNRLLK